MTTDDTPPDAAVVYVAIGRIIRALRRLDQGALSAGLASALGTLAVSGPMRLRDLAAAEGVTPPTMSRIVASLEASGYLARTVDPADARAAVLDLTPSGRDLFNGVKSSRVRHLAEVMAVLPAAQRAALSSGLSTVAKELRARTE